MSDHDDVIARMRADIKTQNNNDTHEPIFMVQRHVRTTGFDTSYSDEHVYLDREDYGEVSLEERKQAYAEAMADPDVDDDAKDIDIDQYEKWLELYYRRKDDHTEEDRQKTYASWVEMLKEQHFEDWCEGNDAWIKTAYKDSWENVQPFFTRAGAEEYLRVNGHNLRGTKDARIYVDSAFRNAEWQAIRALLLKEKP